MDVTSKISEVRSLAQDINTLYHNYQKVLASEEGVTDEMAKTDSFSRIIYRLYDSMNTLSEQFNKYQNSQINKAGLKNSFIPTDTNIKNFRSNIEEDGSYAVNLLKNNSLNTQEQGAEGSNLFEHCERILNTYDSLKKETLKQISSSRER